MFNGIAFFVCPLWVLLKPWKVGLKHWRSGNWLIFKSIDIRNRDKVFENFLNILVALALIVCWIFWSLCAGTYWSTYLSLKNVNEILLSRFMLYNKAKIVLINGLERCNNESDFQKLSEFSTRFSTVEYWLILKIRGNTIADLKCRVHVELVVSIFGKFHGKLKCSETITKASEFLWVFVNVK